MRAYDGADGYHTIVGGADVMRREMNDNSFTFFAGDIKEQKTRVIGPRLSTYWL